MNAIQGFGLCIIGLGALCLFGGGAQGSDGANVPFEIGAEIADAFEESISVKIQQAQTTLPAVKREYMRGMENGRKLFLTIRIMDQTGRVEQIFAEVTGWNGSRLKGTIASRIQQVAGYVWGQEVAFGEGDILDWTVVNPDGRMEGNFIGSYVRGWLTEQEPTSDAS